MVLTSRVPHGSVSVPPTAAAKLSCVEPEDRDSFELVSNESESMSALLLPSRNRETMLAAYKKN